jgi:hypothetical protein
MQPFDDRLYKKLYRAGFVGYVVLFVLAILYYKERTALADTAYHLYVIVTDAAFTIQNIRFGAVATQLYPVLAVKMGLPLSAVMMAYSVGFVCYHFLYYLIIGGVLKRYDFALVLLLLHLLFISDTFYWVQSEFPQGISLLLLLLALCSSIGGKKMWQSVVIACLAAFTIFVVAFMHPLMLFPLAFSGMFFLLQGRERAINWKVVAGIIVVFAAAYVYKNVYYPNEYDTNNINTSAKLLTADNLLSNYQLEHFWANCMIKYYWILIFTVLIVLFYIAKRKWLQLGLFLAFLMGYLLMVTATHPGDDQTDFYMENLYLPLGLFISLPLVFEILPTIYSRNFATVVLLLIVATASVRINDLHKTYTRRLTWERDFLREHLDEKLMVASARVPRDMLQMIWASPYEFWLLSTTENGRTASILISDHIRDYVKYANDPKSFATTWAPTPYSALPSKYFVMRDTVSVYTVLSD